MRYEIIIGTAKDVEKRLNLLIYDEVVFSVVSMAATDNFTVVLILITK